MIAIGFETKEDAERVAELMVQIVEKYEVASLADLYELMGLPSLKEDNRRGWTSLDKMKIKPVKRYLLELPKMEAI